MDQFHKSFKRSSCVEKIETFMELAYELSPEATYDLCWPIVTKYVYLT